jgi:hypothetical protein
MTEVWAQAALWLGLALVATLISIWLRIATALSEIVVGTVSSSSAQRLVPRCCTPMNPGPKRAGGCQGCASSQLTLRQGFERLVRRVAPEVGKIIDVTDPHLGGCRAREPKRSHQKSPRKQ